MNDFSQFKPAERRMNDVVAPVAPVEDTSAATAIGAIAKPLGALAKTGVTAFVQNEVAEAEKQKVQLQTELENQYVAALETSAQMLKQGGTSTTERRRAKTMLSQQEQQLQSLGLSAVSMLDIKKKFEGVSAGAVFKEESAQEVAYKQELEAATKAGFVTSDMTDEQVQAGILLQRKSQATQRAFQAELDVLNLEKSRLGLTQKQQEIADKNYSDASIRMLSNLAANYREPTKNNITSVLTQLKTGQIDRATAEQQLQKQRGDLEALISQASALTDLTQAQAISKPLVDLYDVALANIDSNKVLTEVENQNKIAIEYQKQDLLKEPDMRKVVAASSLFGHNPATAAYTTNAVATILSKNSDDKSKPHDVTDGTQGTSDYLSLVKENLNYLDQVDMFGEPKVDKQELNTNINKVLEGANRYIDAEDLPQQNADILKWLAEENVGSYIKDNLGILSTEARAGLTDTLLKSAENHIYPKVTELLGDLKESERGNVKLVKTGNTIAFRAVVDDNWSKSVANNLNKQVGGALGTYFKAMANLTDDSLDQIIDRETNKHWPEEVPTEDGIYTDEVTGEQFEVRDGRRI